MRTPQASDWLPKPNRCTKRRRCPSASDTKTAPNPPTARPPPTHARNKATQGNATHRVAASSSAATAALVPLERRPRHRRGRHPFRARASASDRPSLPQRQPPHLDPRSRRCRSGEAAARVWVWSGSSWGCRGGDGMEEGTTARWGGRESDTEGSAVNAMASMALSVRLRPSLVQPQAQLRLAALEPFAQNTPVAYTVGDAW
jgi:hypothetical protein